MQKHGASVQAIGKDAWMGKIGTGLSAAALPLVICLAFASAGKVCLAVFFGILTVVLLVATFAALLPGLHKLPGVGAPRLTAGFSANGSPDAVIRIPRRRDAFEGSIRSILIRVGITSHSRADVESALLNFCVPVGLGLQICDHRGQSLDQGKLMPPTQEALPMDYWMIGDLTITGGNGHLFHFRIRIDGPGDYPLKLRLNSRDLYEELVVDGMLRVEEADDLSVRDALSVLIDEGEEVLQRPPDSRSGTSLRVEAMAFTMKAIGTIAELDQPALDKRIADAILDHTGLKEGDDYYRALIATKVRVLYDIRDLPDI